MECAAGTDAIKVTPKGCKPVSKDRCASGFMAPAENVTFPKNPLETCCKCKEGEKCSYCLKEDECTRGEKEKYVTDKDCYTPPPPPPPPPAPKKKKEFIQLSFLERNAILIYSLSIILAVLISILIWKLPRGSSWKFRLMILLGILATGNLLVYFLISRKKKLRLKIPDKIQVPKEGILDMSKAYKPNLR